VQGTEPMLGDMYNPMAGPCKGNSNCEKGFGMRTIDQTTPHDEWIDLRMFWH